MLPFSPWMPSCTQAARGNTVRLLSTRPLVSTKPKSLSSLTIGRPSQTQRGRELASSAGVPVAGAAQVRNGRKGRGGDAHQIYRSAVHRNRSRRPCAGLRDSEPGALFLPSVPGTPHVTLHGSAGLGVPAYGRFLARGDNQCRALAPGLM